MAVFSKVVLGIDPGTIRSGYGVLRGGGAGKVECLALGYKDLTKGRDDAHKLHLLTDLIEGLIRDYEVVDVAVERPFLGKNALSFLKLARAQGVIMASAGRLGCRVFEYSPNTVKKATTGNGLSTKEALQRSLELFLRIKITSYHGYQDATDALAIAFTHLMRGASDTIIHLGGKQNTHALWAAYLRKLKIK